MKNTRFIAVMVALFIVIGTIAASAASAPTKLATPTMQQFKLLQKRVARAEVKVADLQARVSVLEDSTPSPANCYGTIGVSQYNDYLSDDGVSSQTGLDIDTSTSDWQLVTKTC
jgi:hypothetical protein